MTSPATGPARARSRRAVTVTAFAFLVTMMGTTLPTPLYSIYSTELSFSPLTVTVLFAVYAVGVVGALSLFGRLSDDVGRRPVLVAAVGLALLSALLFLLPPSLPLLVVARVTSGLGAGLMSGAGTAAVIDLFPAEKKAAAGTLAVAANTGGLALGTLVAGVLASAAPAPLTIPFAVHLVLCVGALLGLATWAPAPARRGRLRIRPHRLRVPASIRGAFARAVLAAGAGFSVTGVLTAVTALFLARDLHLDSHALAGFVVFLSFAGMAVGQLVARRMRPRAALPVGCAGLVLASAALATALAGASLAPLVVAAAVLGVSGGLCLNAGIATTVEQVPPAHRGEVSSSFFAGLYLMLAVPAIGVGLLASVVGLRQAGLVFAAVVAVLAAAVGIVELVSARRTD
ncbi:MFS transporter [Oerskovia enterophila]|uniref:Multidrug resistance protein MdtD n=1 Tax=Oerskovia enterophila TaxID=43678 RepID=A0ABX2Y091_9CELL|nr:MFS transporter [Oerskovia enterophila]OCI29915.1 putative multidrug resistance protein MdtD [Oerskovia enterophila]